MRVPNNMRGVKPPHSLREIFELKINKTEKCWEWKGCVYRSTGYGIIQYKGYRYYAHRLSFSFYKKEIDDGMFIDHTCKNRSCVNPDHLREVTPKINSLENSNGITAINKSKETCKYGHSLSGDNLKIVNGTRQCVVCVRRRWRNFARSKRESNSNK